VLIYFSNHSNPTVSIYYPIILTASSTEGRHVKEVITEPGIKCYKEWYYKWKNKIEKGVENRTYV